MKAAAKLFWVFFLATLAILNMLIVRESIPSREGGKTADSAREVDGRNPASSEAGGILHAKPGTARTCYVHPVNGNDTQQGTLDKPWRTIKHAISQLRPGDTLYLRDGTFYESDIEVSAAGTASSRITIQNYPNEKPVVDGGCREFREVGNSDWIVHDPGKGIYKSAKTYRAAKISTGYFGKDNGGFRLIPYKFYGHFSTNNEDYAIGDVYAGPGVFWDSKDERIYVRLKPSRNASRMGYSIPSNQDPRRTQMFIFTGGSVLRFTGKAAYIDIKGIDFRYRDYTLEYQSGSHHISLADSNILGGRYHVLIREGVHNLVFSNVSIVDNIPPWMPRSDVKFPSEFPPPAHNLQGAAFNIGGDANNIEIKNCVVRNVFDGIDATRNPHHIQIHHNEFTGIRDDVLQLGSAGYEIEVGYNKMINVAAGVSWNGSGRPPAGKEGTKYIHHNIIDATLPTFLSRSDPKKLLDSRYKGPKGDGWGALRAFGMHRRTRVTGPDPWKIYNNTVKVTKDSVGNRGTEHSYFIESFNPKHPHEVYNNLFIQVNDHWVARDTQTANGSQIFDGNLYHRVGSGLKNPLFKTWRAGSTSRDFFSLNEFKRSEQYRNTRSYYLPGWENSGIEADPRLDSDYRPDPKGPAASGAIALPAGWPGNDRGKYRGALPPGDRTSRVRSSSK
jgi:hypothetical protein